MNLNIFLEDVEATTYPYRLSLYLSLEPENIGDYHRWELVSEINGVELAATIHENVSLSDAIKEHSMNLPIEKLIKMLNNPVFKKKRIESQFYTDRRHLDYMIKLKEDDAEYVLNLVKT